MSLNLIGILFAEGKTQDKQYLCDLATKLANGESIWALMNQLRNDPDKSYIYLEEAVLARIEHNPIKEQNRLIEFSNRRLKYGIGNQNSR